MSDIEAILETGAAAAVEMAASAMAQRGESVGKCANCGTSMIGAYCAVCGQERDTHRRSVWGLLKVFFEDFLSFDSRILRTAFALLFEPGELAIAFRQGRTRRYVPALRLYFFVTLIFFLTLSATNIALVQFNLEITTQKFFTDRQGNVLVETNGKVSPMQGLKADAKGHVYLTGSNELHVPVPAIKADGSITNNVRIRPYFFLPINSASVRISPAVRRTVARMKAEASADATKGKPDWVQQTAFKTILSLEDNPAALNGALTTWIPRVLFLLLPLSALLLALFYIRQRRDFYLVDHLILALNIYSFAFVMFLIAAGLMQLLPGEAVAWLTLAAISFYVLVSMKRFYGQSWLWTGVKFAAVSGVYFLFLFLPAMGAVLALSVFGGNIG